MKITTTGIPYFQGDLMIMRLASPPDTAGKSQGKSVGAHLILAHSETGHHHVIDSRSAQLLIDETNAFIAWLHVTEPAEIEHLREHDRHETYHLDPGWYELRRQVEHTPEGWRAVQD